MSDGIEQGGEMDIEGMAAEVERGYAEERHGTEPRDDELTARPITIIEGLPRDLPPGTYNVTFSGLEYPIAGPPVMTFRYAGATDIPQQRSPAADQADAEDWVPRPHEGYSEDERNQWPREGVQQDMLRYGSEGQLPAHEEADGRVVPDPPEHPGTVTVRKYAGGAQYRTKTGKIITDDMIEAWAAEAEAGYNVDNLRTPPPDLYMVSQVEVLNVSKLARVILALIHGGIITPESIGLMPDPESGLTPGIEQWLRA